eukprot:s2127_g21.t4
MLDEELRKNTAQSSTDRPAEVDLEQLFIDARQATGAELLQQSGMAESAETFDTSDPLTPFLAYVLFVLHYRNNPFADSWLIFTHSEMREIRDRKRAVSAGLQYPKIPGMRYASGSQWFAVTRGMASMVASSFSNASTLVGTIFRDLTAVKQPDESFFQAVVLNTKFCTSYSDFTLHWTDKDSMREVRSLTSEYNILSPGVLGNLKDFAKIEEVRKQSLWAFFARKFDDSAESSQLKDRLDAESSRQSRPKWTRASVPSVERVVEVLASSLAVVKSVKRLQRNHDGIFNLQTLQLQLVREKLATPELAHPLLALRVGCDWNKTELVFDGDVSAVSASSTGPHRCPSLWAVAHWRMSKKPISQELVLVWIDPRGTPMQHAPITISEHSVLLWHRYTATQPLPLGQWSLEVRSNDHVIARRHFFAYGDPSDIPWRSVREYFDIGKTECLSFPVSCAARANSNSVQVALLNQQYLLLRGDMLYLKHEMNVCKNWVQQSVRYRRRLAQVSRMPTPFNLPEPQQPSDNSSWKLSSMNLLQAVLGNASGPDWTTACSITEDDAAMLKMQESSFLGVEGATSLKAEITGKIPELNSAAHYRSARKLVQDLGGAPALKEELIYSGYVDGETSKLMLLDRPMNIFALLSSGTMKQPESESEQDMLGTFKGKFMICRNKLENDINWDNPDMKWVKTSSMARLHRFLTTRDLHYQWFNPLIFGLVPPDDDGVTARSALAEVEQMKSAALLFAKNAGWSDKVGLFVNVFGHNNVNSLFIHVLDMSELGPAFSYHSFKNCPLDDVIKVLREEAASNFLPAPVKTTDLPGLMEKAGARRRRMSMIGETRAGGGGGNFFFAGTDGATSVKAEIVGRLPIIKDAASFRAARRMLMEELGGMPTLKEELMRSGFIDPVTGNLTTGTRPFNVFARIAGGVMTQPGMDKEQEYLGEFQDHFIVASNLPANDEHWDSEDKEWVGKASMSKRHRFLTVRDLHWQWFNVLGFGLLPESKGGAGLGRAIALIEVMKAAALRYAKNCPGWSDRVGLFYHVFGHNSVNSLHLHVLDMAELGPTFWHYEYKNCPLDVVLKVLKEEATSNSMGSENYGLMAEVTEAATAAAKAAAAAAEAALSAQRPSVKGPNGVEILTINVGGELLTVSRQTMLQAPEGSRLRMLFQDDKLRMSQLDANQRPYLNYPAPAFKCIVDHLRLLAELPPANVLEPLVAPPWLDTQVRDLAWILGVENMIVDPQYGTNFGTSRLARRISRPFCCMRRRPQGLTGLASDRDEPGEAADSKV